MLLDFVNDCMEELKETGEVWIEENAFGDVAEFVRNRVCIQLDERDIEYESVEPRKGVYFVKIIKSN